jgi:hypothetical protein
LAEGFQFVYEIPHVVLGAKHDHWAISEFESRQLAQAFLKAVGSSDNKNFARLLKTLEKYLPVFMFLSCLWIITAPRVQQSLELFDEKSGKHKARILQPVDGTFGASTDPGAYEATSQPTDQPEDKNIN